MSWLSVIFGSILAGLIHTVTGFGSGVIMMLVLSHFFSLTQAPAITTSICLGLSTTLAWRYRKQVDWRRVALPLVIYTIGSLLAIQWSKRLDLRVLSIAFGGFLILLAAHSLFFSKRTADLRPTGAMAVVSSAVAGVCQGLFSVGGPIIALYFINAVEDRDEYVGDLQTLFVITGLISLVSRAANGLYRLSFLPLTAAGLVAINVGKRLGLKIAGKLNTAAVRTIVYLYVGLSGVILILQNVL